MTSTRALLKNSLLNLLGQGLPLLAGLVAIPILIHHLGVERFALLTLIWSLIGYFSLFDLGLGRTLTKFLAEKVARRQWDEIPVLMGTGLLLMTLFGLLGSGVLGVFGEGLIRDHFQLGAGLREEAVATLPWVLVAIPLLVLTNGLRGVLEAYGRFDQANWIKGGLGFWMFLGPLLVLPFSQRLEAVVAILVAGRFVAILVNFHLVRSREAQPMRIELRLLPGLLAFGGWLTVTNIVGPMMVYMDRFIIAGLVSMEMVAYYTTPYEVITKLLILPYALCGALFPALVAHLASNRPQAADQLHVTYILTMLMLYPITVVVTLFAREGLALWLNPAFALQGEVVLQWLVAGVFCNSLSQLPFTVVQAAGRPDWAAKVHVLEVPFYLMALVTATHQWGIVGAAMVWSGRVVVDTVVFFWMTHRLLPESGPMLRRMLPMSVLALALLPPLALLAQQGFWLKLLFTLIFLPALVWGLWKLGLTAAQKQSYITRLPVWLRRVT